MDQHSTYVIYVGAGRESATERLVRRMVPGELYDELFAPRFERKLRRGGTWYTVDAPWVPGYLFVVTADVDAFRNALWSVPALTKLLGTSAEVAPLGEREVHWLERLTHPGERVVGMSEGYIVGDRVYVTTGPLVGFESQIIRIDRHKRYAWLDFSVGDNDSSVRVGLEIVSKTGVSAEPDALPRAA